MRFLRRSSLRATCVPNTNDARGRIALSGGGLRPHGTGRRVQSHISCESARNLWSGPAEVKEYARNLRLFCVLWCAYRACRVPLGLPTWAGTEPPGGHVGWHVQVLARIALAGLLMRAPAAAPTAQDYPNRPVTLVVPYAAGGGLDVFARQLAQRLSERLGKPFVVENRTGAGTAIGATYVAQGGARRLHASCSAPVDAVRDQRDAEQEPALRSGQGFCADRAHLERAVPAAGAIATLPVKIGGRLDQVGEVAAEASSSYGIGRSRLAAAPEHGAAQDHDRHQHRARALSRRRAGAQRSGRRSHPDAVRASRRRCCRCCAPARCARSACRRPRGFGADGRTSRRSRRRACPASISSSWQMIVAPAGTPKPIVDRLHRELKAILALPEMQKDFDKTGRIAVDSPPPEELLALHAQRDRAARQGGRVGGHRPVASRALRPSAKFRIS